MEDGSSNASAGIRSTGVTLSRSRRISESRVSASIESAISAWGPRLERMPATCAAAPAVTSRGVTEAAGFSGSGSALAGRQGKVIQNSLPR